MFSKKWVGYLALLTFLAFFLISINASAYDITFYEDNTGSPVTTYTPSFYPRNITNGSCSITIDARVDSNKTGAYYVTTTWYSPDDVDIGTGTRNFYTDQLCAVMGVKYVNTTWGTRPTFEAKTTTSHTATSLRNYVASTLNCTADEITFYSGSSGVSGTDSRGKPANGYEYQHFACSSPACETGTSLSGRLQDSNFGICEITQVDPLSSSVSRTGNNIYYANYISYYYPFNSGNGNVKLNVTVDSDWTSYAPANGLAFYYYTPDSPSTLSSIGSFGWASVTNKAWNLTLSPWTDYVILGIGYFECYATCSVTFDAPKIEMTIDTREIAWVCGDWSECLNGTQYRECIDPEGIATPKFEYRFCYVAPVNQIYFGFEDVVSENVWYPYTYYGNPLIFPFCGGCCCWATTKPIDYPKDWYVQNPKLKDKSIGVTGRQFDFIKMTSDYSYEGDKSLKMWYLPPQNNIPDGYNCTLNMTTNVSECDYVHCVNLTAGVYPDINRGFNETVFLERNITLPTPYMGISFKVRKCVEPELKTSAVLLCHGDKCYTSSETCGVEVLGRVTTYLKNVTSGNFLVDITSDVNYANLWEIREYAIDSLQPNETYTIGFGIIPPYKQVDSRCFCIYLDDVNIDIRTQPLTCVSECVGITRIDRTCKQYVGSTCVICEEKSIENSPLCISEPEVIGKVQNCTDWCGCDLYLTGHTDYYTKFVGSILQGCNITIEGTEKCCQWTEVKDSEYCVNYCTQKEAEEEAEETMFTPVVNITEWEQAGMPSWALGFLTPVVIAVIIALGITVGVSAKIGEKFGKGLPWQFALVVFLTILSIFSLPQVGLFPWWLLLIMIIISGALLIKFGGILGGE